MLRTRVIPTLLIRNNGLVKGERFQNHQYVGDPLNAVKIFNEKEVDELVLLDISATQDAKEPNYDLIQDIASEAFMPLAYGGGINNLKQVEKIIKLGIEKIIINSSSYFNKSLLKEISQVIGAQSLVVSVDVKKTIFKSYSAFVCNGRTKIEQPLIEYIKWIESQGVGEIILCSIDKEGTQKGYDLKLIEAVTRSTNIPIIASGGAGQLSDFADAVIIAGASAVAAGSLFVYHGKHKAVLITYPEYKELEKLLDGEKSIV